MGDEDGGLVGAETVELVEDLLLGDGIQGGGGLVQDQDVGVAVEGAGDGQLLPLTDGQLNALLLKDAHEGGIEATGQMPDVVGGVGLLGGLADLLLLQLLADVSEVDVLGDADGVLAEVLEDDAVHAVQILDVVGADILAVQKDHTLGGIVETGQKF